MTGKDINEFINAMPELDSIQAIKAYVVKNLHGREDVSFYDIAVIFIQYARVRKALHEAINFNSIPEEFLREYTTLVNDIISSIYSNKFEYQCPSCDAIYQIEMTNEEHERFIDILFSYGLEDGMKDMEEDDILYKKYKACKCKKCGAEYEIRPNIFFNGVYTC